MAIFYNQATISYNGQTQNSNITVGELLDAAGVDKEAVFDEYGRNDVLTYTVSIRNTGSSAMTNLIVTDNLGAYTFGNTTLVPLEYVEGSIRYYVNGVLNDAPDVDADTALFINGITVPAGGNVLLIYAARTNEFAPLEVGSQITNTVTVNGATEAEGALTAQETVTAAETTELSITKFMMPDTVTDNGEITYTFIIQNTGNTATSADGDLTVTDTFNPILDISEVTFNGEEWSEPANYTYNEATGEFATVPGQITVPAATYTRDPETGAIILTPGVSVLTITGTV